MIGLGLGLFGGGRLPWTPVNLARNSVAPFWDVTATNYQDVAGVTLSVDDTDPIALMRDASGGGVEASQPVAAQQPQIGEILAESGTSYRHVLFDGIDDNLTANLSDMGSSATKWQVGFAGVTLEDALTIPAGSYDLPTSDWGAHGVIDRALSTNEINRLLHWAQQHHTPAKYTTMKTRMDVICMNAVDVKIYDTSRDSDGGAWIAAATTQSWYLETLNTATRGATRNFPKLAVIVAETTRVVIYDGTDPTLPMWMVFEGGNATYWPATSASAITSVEALNGTLALGTNPYDYFQLNVISEEMLELRNGNGLSMRYGGTVAGRNGGLTKANDPSLPAITNRVVNDVAITALPDAPIDGATGLSVPTIAVATNAGVTVLKDNASAVHYASSTGAAGYEIYEVQFDPTSNDLWVRHAYAPNYSISTLWRFFGAGIRDLTGNAAPGATHGDQNFGYSRETPDLMRGDPGTTMWFAKCVLPFGGNKIAVGNSTGLAIGDMDNSVAADGMVAHVTNTYSTGWMVGDIKGAFLCATDDSDLVGGTDPDRSVNATPLTVHGTMTREPVADGAELMAYSGFSSSNYLEQAYTSDLDFGTGDFCVMGWANGDTNGYFMARGSGTNTIYLRELNGVLKFLAGNVVLDGGSLPNNQWCHVAAVRKDGLAQLYMNGVLDASMPNTSTVTDVGAVLRLGIKADAIANSYTGSLALWRIGATAPTAAQIAKIYADERPMFQPGAACTLAGASAGVTALAQDRDLDLLHVGQAEGVSIFGAASPLVRMSETNTTITTCLDVMSGMVAGA